MNRLTQLAIDAEEESYGEGLEDGFWRGFMIGAEAQRRFIMGEADAMPQTPAEFRPMGGRFNPVNFWEVIR